MWNLLKSQTDGNKEENGDCLGWEPKGDVGQRYEVFLTHVDRHGDLTYSKVTTANNAILYI